MKKFLLVVLLGSLVLIASSPAQTVLKRMRLGNEVEGMTFIDTGAYAKHIAILDGNDVIAVPAEGKGNTPFKKLFDVTSVGFTIAPRGLAWIESEKLFIFTDAMPGGPSTIFRLSDHQGRPKGSFTFTWPDDYVDAAPYVEEIVWVPSNATRYAGDLIFIARPTTGPFDPTLFVMNRSGEFVAQINLVQGDPYIDPIGMAYKAPGRLVLGTFDGYVAEIDLDGNLMSAPKFFADATDIEGVAALASGRIAITAHSNGKLVYLDPNLNRLPEERSYKAGFGLATAQVVAWDSTTNEYIVWVNDNEANQALPQLAAVSADLKSSHIFFDMELPEFLNQNFGRMDYVPTQDAVVMPWRSTPTRHLQFFSSTLGSWPGPTIGTGTPAYRLVAFAYVPEIPGYVASRSGLSTLDFFDMNAQPIPQQFDLSPYMPAGTLILDVAHYFPTASSVNGEYLVLVSSNPRQLLKLDSNGTLLATYDASSLHAPNLNAVKYISSGPYAGAFVGVDNNNDELLVFRLP